MIQLLPPGRHYLLARDEALGYHHLGDDKSAWTCYERAVRMLTGHLNPRAQQGDLARNRLLALPGACRFSLSEADGLASPSLKKRTTDWACC